MLTVAIGTRGSGGKIVHMHDMKFIRVLKQAELAHREPHTSPAQPLVNHSTTAQISRCAVFQQKNELTMKYASHSWMHGGCRCIAHFYPSLALLLFHFESKASLRHFNPTLASLKLFDPCLTLAALPLNLNFMTLAQP